MNQLTDLLSNKVIFFNYMKEKYEVHTKSNIFLRDLLYAIKSFYAKKGMLLNYAQAELIALDFTNELVKSGELELTKKNTWKVNFLLENSVVNINT